MRPLPWLVVTALLLAAPTLAGTKLWTSDDILSLKAVSDPQLSPNGRWVAYVVQELNADGSDYQTDVWLVSSSGGDARRLTTATAIDEHPRWSPDGRTLAFLSERPRAGVKPADAATDEGKRQVWLIHPDGGEAWQLSEAGGGVSEFSWSPKGDAIGFLAKDAKTDEQKKKEKDKDDAWTPKDHYAWNRLWVIDVASRKATQLTSGDFHVTGLSFSPDGRRIAIAAQPTPLLPDQFNSDLYLVAASGGKPTLLVQRKGDDDTPSWSPDGKWIAFVSQDGRTTEWYSNTYLCVVPAGGGATKNLTADFDERATILGGGSVSWSPDNSSLLFFSEQKTGRHLFRAYVDGRPVEAITQGNGVEGSPSLDGSGTHIAYLKEDGDHPREVWCGGFPSGERKPITDTNPQARDRLSFRKDLVSWPGADDETIEGLLILPPNYRPGTRVPLLLNVHGGPAGTHTNTCTVASRLYPWPLLAQKGWAILMPNPRGSGGYGERFRTANVRDWGGKDYVDLMRGVDAMIARGIADPNRLAVCGWSYGGYMTSTIVTKTDRFRAAIVGAGVTDLMSMAGTCDIPEFNRSYFGAWPWEDAQVYVDHSALMHAGNVKTPTLLVHGEKDDRVPTSQGWEFYLALKKIGVPTDLLLLPRQPHGPREPRLLKTVQQWHLDWLDKYALGAPKTVTNHAGLLPAQASRITQKIAR